MSRTKIGNSFNLWGYKNYLFFDKLTFRHGLKLVLTFGQNRLFSRVFFKFYPENPYIFICETFKKGSVRQFFGWAEMITTSVIISQSHFAIKHILCYIIKEYINRDAKNIAQPKLNMAFHFSPFFQSAHMAMIEALMQLSNK